VTAARPAGGEAGQLTTALQRFIAIETAWQKMLRAAILTARRAANANPRSVEEDHDDPKGK